MTFNERSRENQAIVCRDLKDENVVWDILPSGSGAERSIAERITQVLVPK